MNTYPLEINDLTNAEVEKIAVVLWKLLIDLGIMDTHSKVYDPLTIDEDTAHSYVFDMEDGGRHHSYKDLNHLVNMMLNETVEMIKKEIKVGDLRSTL